MVGASAAISGLMGSYLLLYPGSSMCYCPCFRFICKCFKVVASPYLISWFIFQLILLILFETNIAIWAHIAGLYMGILLTYLLAPRKRINELRRKMFVDKEYEGLKPLHEELTRHSLGPLIRSIIVALSIFLVIISVNALFHAQQYDGKYYNIYTKEEVITTKYYNPLLINYPGVNPGYMYTRKILLDIIARIEDSPPKFKNKVLDKSTSHSLIGAESISITIIKRLVSLKSIYLEGITRNILILLVLNIIVFTGLVYILLSPRYSEVEVTYLPREMLKEYSEGAK